jgi:hypothetical protein
MPRRNHGLRAGQPVEHPEKCHPFARATNSRIIRWADEFHLSESSSGAGTSNIVSARRQRTPVPHERGSAEPVTAASDNNSTPRRGCLSVSSWAGDGSDRMSGHQPAVQGAHSGRSPRRRARRGRAHGTPKPPAARATNLAPARSPASLPYVSWTLGENRGRAGKHGEEDRDSKYASRRANRQRVVVGRVRLHDGGEHVAAGLEHRLRASACDAIGPLPHAQLTRRHANVEKRVGQVLALRGEEGDGMNSR